MHRTTTILLVTLAVVATLATRAWAIGVKPSADSTRQDQPPTVTQDATAPPAETTRALRSRSVKESPTGSLLDRLKRRVRQPDKVKSQQYDDFIDADGDGVDDRLGRGAKVKAAPPPEKTSTTNDSTKGKSKRSARKAVVPKEKP